MPIFGGLGQGNRCANHYFTNLLDHDCDVYGALVLRNTTRHPEGGESKIGVDLFANVKVP